jgi:hypothetical protein
MTDTHPDTTTVTGAVAAPCANVSTHSSGSATTAAHSTATTGSAARTPSAPAAGSAAPAAAPSAFSEGGCDCQKDDGQAGYESATELHR